VASELGSERCKAAHRTLPRSTTLRGNVDIYNVLNQASILSMTAGYGTNWLVPDEIMGGRLCEFSGQIEF
jgi:hypothetical protein